MEEERRTNTIDLQVSILKLISELDTIENNINIKLESYKDKIINIEENLSNKITVLEANLDRHFVDQATYLNSERCEILDLKNKYTILLGRVNKLELEPTMKNANIVTSIQKTMLNVVAAAISTGIVGFVVWLFIQYVINKGIKL